jgi:hypothetical protein
VLSQAGALHRFPSVLRIRARAQYAWMLNIVKLPITEATTSLMMGHRLVPKGISRRILSSIPAYLHPLAERRKHPRQKEPLRRAVGFQVEALEILTHGLDYLSDRALQCEAHDLRAIRAAIQLLTEKEPRLLR